MLGNDTTLTSTSGAGISLGVIAPTTLSDGGTATYALTIDGGGTVTFNGGASLTSFNLGSSPVILAAAAYGYFPGDTLTTSSAAAQVYNGTVTLETDTTLASTGGGDITLNSTMNGAYGLAISTTGTTTLQSVGQTTALAGLSISGPITLNGNVTTTAASSTNTAEMGVQSYGGPITLENDITLTSSGGVSLGNVIGGSHSLTIDGGQTVTFTGGTVSVAALNLDSSSLDLTGSTTIDTPAALTLIGVSGLSQALTISDAGGLTLGATTLSSLTDIGGAVTLSSNAYNITTLDLTGSVTLGSLVTIEGTTTTLGNVTGAEHNLQLVDTGATALGNVTGVDILTDDTGTLTLNGGTISASIINLDVPVILEADTTMTGTTTLGAVTGGGHALTIIGNAELGSISGVTTLTANGVTLNGGNVTAGTINFGTGGVDLAVSSTLTTTSGLTMNGTVTGNSNALTIVGNATLGGVLEVTSLLDAAGAVTLTGGSYSAELGITLTGGVTLGATGTTTFSSTTDGVIDLGSVTGGTGVHNLTISTGGAATLGSVSGVATLKDTTGTLTLDGGTLSAASVNLLGAAITLGANTTVTDSSLASLGNVTGESNALTINGGGATTLQAVSGVSNLTVSNAVTLDGNSSTTGAQVYNGATILGANVTLASTGGGALTFTSTVDGAQALALDTTGATTLGAVGQTTALTSLTTDAGGTTMLNGNVKTTGAQTYGDGVLLGNDLILSSTASGAIALNFTVDGAHALTITTGGAVTLGTVGGTTALSSLTVSGGSLAALADDVTVSGPLSLTTTGSAITESGGAITVDSTASFNAGTDAISLTDAGNAFTGAVSLAGSSASITDSDALTLGNSTLSGTLTVSAAAGTTVTGLVSASTTTVSAGSLQIGNGSTGSIMGNVTSNGSILLDAGSGGGSILGNVALGSGGVISGNGTVSGKITVGSGGETYPGDPRILTAGSVEYQSGSTAVFAVQTTAASAHPAVPGTDYDQIALTAGTPATLLIDSGVTTLQLNLTPASLAFFQSSASSADHYFLFTLGSGTSSGSFSNLTLTVDGTSYDSSIVNGVSDFAQLGLQFDLTYSGDASLDTITGGNDVGFSVIDTPLTVPEPATWALLFLGGLVLALGHRCHPRIPL